MKTTAKLQMNRFKNAVVLFFVITIFTTGSVTAQKFSKSFGHSRYFRSKQQGSYLGIEASFGIHALQLSSDISAIDGMKVLQEGGSAGVVFGNNIIQGKIKQGYYYSASSVPHTTDLISTEGVANVYVLQIFDKKFRSFEPYLLGGVERQSTKLYGFYLEQEKNVQEPTTSQTTTYKQRTNYSVSEQPYLGKLSTVRASWGVGFVYHLPSAQNFVNLFGEVKYGQLLTIAANNTSFNHTSVSDELSINVGVSFGLKR